MPSRNATALAWAFLCLGAAASAEPSALFTDTAPLAVTLQFDPRALCRNKAEPGCSDPPGVMSYVEPDGAPVTLAITLRARGGWRLDEANCAIPPLFIVFPETDGVGEPAHGLFANQTFLPLTTHCQPRPSRYEQYVVREYLAYALYGLFSEAGLGARLLHVTYVDPRTGKGDVRYAFLTEHFDRLAARRGAAVSRPPRFDPRTADPMEMATLDLFQYMIGNTDWSVVIPHNIIFLAKADGRITAVPYDFDFAGLVDADYASPSRSLPIRDVRRRLYRGFCLPGIRWEDLFAAFIARHDDVMARIDAAPGLSDYSRKRSRAYIKQFYKTLGSAASRNARIVEACRPLPATATDRND